MTAITMAEQLPQRRARTPALWLNLDRGLLSAIAVLTLLGLVMVLSASVSLAESQLGDAFYYFKRQLLFLCLGVGLAFATLRLRLASWQKFSGWLLIITSLLLLLLFVPGFGREVNGAVRWIPLGLINLQVSELSKLALLVYVAAYLVRHGEAVRTRGCGYVSLLIVLILSASLLLGQPDFGTVVVILATSMSMLFIAGAPLLWLGLLIGGAIIGGWLLVATSGYRLARLTAFVDPWQDPFASGFQLTQSLIAIGRGEWMGVGLGGSVQKLFYLPEAHTDFLFAVLAEELGLLGVVGLIGLYGYIVARAFSIGRGSLRQGLHFGGYLAFGIGLWFGLQAFINIGVNMGLLPTKGLTLPLMSYGGSSLVCTLVTLALLLRAGFELRVARISAQPVARRRS